MDSTLEYFSPFWITLIFLLDTGVSLSRSGSNSGHQGAESYAWAWPVGATGMVAQCRRASSGSHD